MPPVDPSDPRVQAGVAVAGAALQSGAAGPWGVVAGTVLSTGLAYWADYARKMAEGRLTEDDVRNAAAMAHVELDGLRADVEARERAEGKLPTRTT